MTGVTVRPEQSVRYDGRAPALPRDGDPTKIGRTMLVVSHGSGAYYRYLRNA